MAGTGQTILGNDSATKISSPDQLTDYLHVTTPSIWVVLLAVIMFLAGLIAWSCVGTLETTANAVVMVEDGNAEIVTEDTGTLEAGMILRVLEQEGQIESTGTNDYGMATGTAHLALSDGLYEGVVVLESTHPISFLLETR